jgi:hypothetical protein
MKTAGIVMIVVGTLFALGGLTLGFTKYNLNSPRELRMFLGGTVCWGLVAVAGIVLVVVDSVKPKDKDRER